MIKKNLHILYRMIFATMLLLALVQLVYALCNLDVYYHYKNGCFQDILINYEGGFVRRGLMGEILYMFYQVEAYHVRNAAGVVLLISVLILLFLLVRMFLRRGWSLMLLVVPVLLIRPVLQYGHLFFNRRDALMLVFAYLIFALYKRYVSQMSGWYLLAMEIVSVVAVLMYEPIFFSIFPLLFLFHWSRIYDCSASIFKSLGQSVAIILPAGVAMLLVCICKGNQEIVDAIWLSWEPCMRRFPLDSNQYLYDMLSSLTWDSAGAFKFHLKRTWFNTFIWGIPAFPMTFASIAGLYYLATRLNTLNPRINIIRTPDSVQISNYVLVQFVCMLPMFTILSCDMVRVSSTWILSSLFAYHLLGNWNVPALSRMSQRIQSRIEQSRLLTNPVFYLLLMLFLPMADTRGADFDSMFVVYRGFIHNMNYFADILF